MTTNDQYQNELDDVMSELNLKTKLFLNKLKEQNKGPKIDIG